MIEIGDVVHEAVGRKHDESRVVCVDEIREDKTVATVGRSRKSQTLAFGVDLGRVAQRCLVSMVTIGDQHRTTLQRADDAGNPSRIGDATETMRNPVFRLELGDDGRIA